MSIWFGCKSRMAAAIFVLGSGLFSACTCDPSTSGSGSLSGDGEAIDRYLTADAAVTPPEDTSLESTAVLADFRNRANGSLLISIRKGQLPAGDQQLTFWLVQRKPAGFLYVGGYDADSAKARFRFIDKEHRDLLNTYDGMIATLESGAPDRGAQHSAQPQSKVPKGPIVSAHWLERDLLSVVRSFLCDACGDSLRPGYQRRFEDVANEIEEALHTALNMASGGADKDMLDGQLSSVKELIHQKLYKGEGGTEGPITELGNALREPTYGTVLMKYGVDTTAFLSHLEEATRAADVIESTVEKWMQDDTVPTAHELEELHLQSHDLTDAAGLMRFQLADAVKFHLKTGGEAGKDSGGLFGENEKFSVIVQTEPHPISKGELFQMELSVKLKSEDQALDVGQMVTVDATMPEHHHGMNVIPKVSAGGQPGHFQVEGMLFHMPGHWLITVWVAGHPEWGHVSIPVQVE